MQICIYANISFVHVFHCFYSYVFYCFNWFLFLFFLKNFSLKCMK